MRSHRAHLPLALFTLFPLSVAPGCAHDPQRIEAESTSENAVALERKLVVHEWGTFTSLAGAEGTSLDGLHHATDPLPAFVHAAGPAARQSPFHLWGDSSSYIPARNVNMKMETPVIYFYSGAPARVQVRVDFPGGLLSEWYPAASEVLPAPAALTDPAVDLAKIERSSLSWDMELTPFAQGAP